MSEAPAQLEARRLLDSLRAADAQAQDVAAALAGLVYLRWIDFQDAEREAMAAFEETSFEAVLPASQHWRTWHSWSPGERRRFLAHTLPDTMESLGNVRHSAVATHLSRLRRPFTTVARRAPAVLEAAVEWLKEQQFETPTDRHQLLVLVDQILDGTNTKFAGQFRTPPAIVKLVVALAAPKAGERIYDPCFGWAGLLTAAADYASSREQDRYARFSPGEISIAGVEINDACYAVALGRLALAGVEDPRLELGDSLERAQSDHPSEGGFDVVVANPPWGMKVDSHQVSHFPVRTTESAGLFVQHILSQLRPDGRAVVVVPNGLLFRGGPEQRLRQWLLEQHTIEAIVAVPEGAFMPYTAIRTNILLLRRGGRTSRIRMADAGSLFHEVRRGRAPEIDSAMLAEFVARIRGTTSDEEVWDVDVEPLEKADYDLTPKRRDRSTLLGLLDSLRSDVPVVQLKDCCAIRSGTSVASRDLIDALDPRAKGPGGEPLWRYTEDRLKALHSEGRLNFGGFTGKPAGGEGTIPYIRIRDVGSGEVRKFTAWVEANASKAVDPKAKLRAGDVLLSKSGTIGKVGLVRNGAVGAVAASGFFVLRADKDRLDPHFLVAYFESAECRSWLDERARGAAIRHLSQKVLNELPVPLPPPQIQQRAASEHRDHGVDVLAYLADFFAKGRRDPVLDWIDTVLKGLPQDAGAIADSFDLAPLDQLAERLQPLRNDLVHNAHVASPLAGWFLAISDSVAPLQGVRHIPRGPGLLSILQESLGGLKRLSATVRSHMPSESRALELTNALQKWLAKACDALLGGAKVTISTEASALVAGESAEVEAVVRNPSALPLRDIHVSTEPPWAELDIPYLAEGSSAPLRLKGIAPKTPGKMSIVASWTAKTIDGQRISDSRELAFDVVEQSLEAPVLPTEDLGTSPYVCGDPVRPERNDVFVGRGELLDQIRRQIVHSGNVVLLEGNRRSGKSSILCHLEGQEAVPGWLGVYCSLQGAEGSNAGTGVPTVEVFREIANSIAKGLSTLGVETPLPNGQKLPPGVKLGIMKACREGISAEAPFSDFREYFEVALEVLAAHSLGLLLMLDEFDKLQQGIDNGVTSPQVPENIRFLVQTYPRFSAILTGSRRLKRLREEYWSALFGLGTRLGVTKLSATAAKRLVTEPVKGRLTYSDEAVERAITLTACQPYLLQCLCNRIFDLASKLKTRSVTLDSVNHAADALVEDNEHFAALWDYAGTARRRLILAICQKDAAGPDPLQLGTIQERLSAHGVEIDEDQLISDLEFLRELELLDLSESTVGRQYTLTIPLMGTWIERQQDYAVLVSKARMESEDHSG